MSGWQYMPGTAIRKCFYLPRPHILPPHTQASERPWDEDYVRAPAGVAKGTSKLITYWWLWLLLHAPNTCMLILFFPNLIASFSQNRVPAREARSPPPVHRKKQALLCMYGYIMILSAVLSSRLQKASHIEEMSYPYPLQLFDLSQIWLLLGRHEIFESEYYILRGAAVSAIILLAEEICGDHGNTWWCTVLANISLLSIVSTNSRRSLSQILNFHLHFNAFESRKHRITVSAIAFYYIADMPHYFSMSAA